MTQASEAEHYASVVDIDDAEAESAQKGKGPHAFRTISEVAEELKIPQHVLRFWETRFEQVKPLKRGGGRRYYRPEDVALLRQIADLLYVKGYTIKGVQRVLAGEPEEADDTEVSSGNVEKSVLPAAVPENLGLLQIQTEMGQELDKAADLQLHIRRGLSEAIRDLSALRRQVESMMLTSKENS